MCLITPNKEPKIAKKDIKVYKILTNDLNAPFHTFQYEIGKLNRVEIAESNKWYSTNRIDNKWLNDNYPSWQNEDNTNLICLGQGFHCAKGIKIAKEMFASYLFFDFNNPSSLFVCTIPKGSEYYDSPFGYLVSNSLVINGLYE